MMWIVYSLLGALGAGVVATLTKAGLKNVDPVVGVAIQSVLLLVLTWAMVAVQGNLGQVSQIERQAWIYLVLAGVVTSVSYWLLFKALKLGDASRVVPLDRLSLVFGIILAAVFLKEKITASVACGGALMAAGALLIALSKR
jgi:bacterial/archaeal transporter family protein